MLAVDSVSIVSLGSGDCLLTKGRAALVAKEDPPYVKAGHLSYTFLSFAALPVSDRHNKSGVLHPPALFAAAREVVRSLFCQCGYAAAGSCQVTARASFTHILLHWF